MKCALCNRKSDKASFVEGIEPIPFRLTLCKHHGQNVQIEYIPAMGQYKIYPNGICGINKNIYLVPARGVKELHGH